MPNAHRINASMSNASTNGKNSLTFESIVCSQLELKRHAASFSRRRSTVCRRPSMYSSSPAAAAMPINPFVIPNKLRMSVSIADSGPRTSILELSPTFSKGRRQTSVRKQSRTLPMELF